ncbi:MAG: imidazole glycerol phosphate synthase cyclase subunit [Melioribacteraceae bacterium]|nr:MAG: imidazole glycerol phosphate synthase cyclase subunit [Melioribacteraceae bacterium]
MSKNIRIIPRLDIKGPNVVKGVHLEGLRVLGKPDEMGRFYYENGADELFYQDTVASLYGRNHLDDLIRKIAKEIFIPLTVGGGLRTIDDMQKVLLAGADKIAINTTAIKNPEIIQSASKYFGSSTIVISIEAIKQPDGNYLAFTDNGRDYTGIEVVHWAKRVEELGAGEIVITSVDREGTGQGFDLELVKRVSEAVGIPVIAHGGAGNIHHIYQVIIAGKADAVAISSILHYNFIKDYNIEMDRFNEEGNIDFLKSGKENQRIDSTNLLEIKNYLFNKGINCRS